MGLVTRDMILAAEDRKPIAIEVPEWGGTIFVRVMSGRDKDRFESSCRNKDGKFMQEDFRAKHAAAVICDEQGNLLFSEADVGILTQKSTAALDRCIDASNKANGIGPEAVDDAEKNLRGGRKDSSTSA